MRLFAVLFSLLLACPLAAQQSVRTQELEKQRKALLAEISATNRLLSENKKSMTNVLRNLNLVVQQIGARKKLILVLEKEIRVLNEEIQFKEFQIKKMDKDLQLKKKKYTASIRKMYEQKQNQSQMLFILSADNPAQSFRRMLYLRKYADWRKQQAEEISAQQQQITAEKQALLAAKHAKEELAFTKKTEEDRLLQEESAKKVEVSGLQRNQKKLEAEMATKKKQAAALDREIARIIAEEVAKAKKAAKSEPKTERKAQIAGGYAMTKEEQTLSSTFAENKGKLPFPMKGTYRIVAGFGQQQYGDLKNTQYNSNGIDIRTTPGTNARAVFPGVVTRIFIVPGYQNSIILRHGNYLTLYSCLKTVFVKQGDKVAAGQEIGEIYANSEANNETVLHFELWKEQTKLNPEQWLNR